MNYFYFACMEEQVKPPSDAFVSYPPVDEDTVHLLPEDIKASKFKTQVEQMNSTQAKVFQILLNLYYGHFAKSIEPVVNHRDQKKRFMWSQDTWIINCIKAVYELSNEPQDFPHDCWFHSGHPIKAEPMIRENRGNQGTRYFKLEDTDGRNAGLELHLLGAALMFPQSAFDLSREIQVRHRCVLHSWQLCWNPWHLRIGTDLDNKSDIGCRFGSAFWCPHDPVCLWNNALGKPIHCRNLTETLIPTCDCIVSCKSWYGRKKDQDTVPINVHSSSVNKRRKRNNK